MKEDDYIRSLKEYIAAYPEEKKADEATTAARLAGNVKALQTGCAENAAAMSNCAV